jgi:hypothetical protein
VLTRVTAFRRHLPLTDRAGLRRVARAAFVCALALTCLAGPTLAADEDEEDSIETKIIKGILGINDKDSIDYRERPPLVVPPNRNLPPPETTSSVANPAWPKDPEIVEKKKRSAAAKQQRRRDPDEDGKPLTPAQLEVGRAAGAGRATGPGVIDGDRSRRSPAELGNKGNPLAKIFSSDGGKGEVATFTGEPQRSSLTQPPPGYMTPSPSHPYGLGVKKEAAKPYDPMNRSVDTHQ